MWKWLARVLTRRTKRQRRSGAAPQSGDAAREAHYMRNFYSYDGSEQEEYDDDKNG